MTYCKNMQTIAKQIIDQCDTIRSLEGNRNDWINPEQQRVKIGGTYYYVVRKDGTVTTGLEAVQAEMLKVIDRQLFKANSKLEGLRFELVQLGKTGGEA